MTKWPSSKARQVLAPLSLDPSYAPSIKNLERSTGWGWKTTGKVVLEEVKKDEV